MKHTKLFQSIFVLLNLTQFPLSFANQAIFNSHSQVSQYKFDFLLDENIDRGEPRLKSLIYVALHKKNTIIKITYLNPNALKFSESLANVLTQNGVTVLKPQQIFNSSPDADTQDVVLTMEDKKGQEDVTANK